MALKQGNSDSYMAAVAYMVYIHIFLQLLHADETVRRKHLMLKFFVADICDIYDLNYRSL